jgi:hypothetical protein
MRQQQLYQLLYKDLCYVVQFWVLTPFSWALLVTGNCIVKNYEPLHTHFMCEQIVYTRGQHLVILAGIWYSRTATNIFPSILKLSSASCSLQPSNLLGSHTTRLSENSGLYILQVATSMIWHFLSCKNRFIYCYLTPYN